MLGEVEDEPAVDFRRRFGTVDKCVEQRTDHLRRHAVHVLVDVVHHVVVEYILGGAEDEGVVQRHVVEVVRHEVFIPLLTCHGSSVVMVRGYIGLLGGQHHSRDHAVGILLYEFGAQTVDPPNQDGAVFVAESGGIHGATCHIGILVDDFLRTVEVEEQLVLLRPFGGHAHLPVFILGMEGETLRLVVHHERHVTVAVVCDVIESRLERFLALEDKFPAAVVDGGVKE